MSIRLSGRQLLLANPPSTAFSQCALLLSTLELYFYSSDCDRFIYYMSGNQSDNAVSVCRISQLC